MTSYYFYAGYIVIGKKLVKSRKNKIFLLTTCEIIIMIKRNAFLTAALEHLQQGTGVQLAAQPPVTETNVDTTTDAVAELMEKNTQLAESNATLESETFDNDVDTIQSTSDSVSEDLEEAVQVGVALEGLARIIDLSIKSGQVNQATNASWAHALENYSAFAGLKNPMPALESAVTTTSSPAEQAETIGEAAKSKAAEIGKKLMEGLRRLAGWVLNVIRSLFSRIEGLSKKAKELGGKINEIDSSKTIEAEAFISSLRLVKNGGDPNKQFKEYGEFATKAMYGFFNNSFNKTFMDSLKDASAKHGDDAMSRVTAKTIEIIKVMMGALYPENGNLKDVSGSIPNTVSDREVTVALTKPCIGGLQLYVAATLENEGDDGWFCKSGISKNQPEIDHPQSIPVVDSHLAQDYIGLIQTWMRDQRVLESNIKVLQATNFVHNLTGSSDSLQRFLSAMTAILTGCMPQLLRLNIQNSANFLAYVERSIAVSKAAVPEKK